MADHCPPVAAALPNRLRQGLQAAWPICFGYVPIGLAFGVLASQAGLSLLQIGLMSLIVFAGSSQFIAVSMLQSSASPLAIVTTTFVVNLRHVLMSAALAMHLRGTAKLPLAGFAYGVTDESFAVNQARFVGGVWDLHRSMVVNTTANWVWIASTVAGGALGTLLPAGALGLDYALTAMFIGLLTMQLRSRLSAWVALLAGVLAGVLASYLPGNLHVVAAAAIAATVGTMVKRQGGKRSTRAVI